MYTEKVKELIEQIKKYDINLLRHSIFVMAFSNLIMDKINFPQEQRKDVLMGALLHDIGKIKIKKEILNKPSKLNESEWVEIKKHPFYGASIIKQYDSIKHLCPLILHHHERWDGTGYLQIKGENICLGARIIALADAVDAMLYKRPYQSPKKSKEILIEIKKNTGRQFDPGLICSVLEIEQNIHLINNDKLVKEQQLLENLIFKSIDVMKNLSQKMDHYNNGWINSC
ncbi:MAG: HD domain-containing protein [Clostridia bacterium]|nr:HD domain-containing protein [Clostridia bacterium]